MPASKESFQFLERKKYWVYCILGIGVLVGALKIINNYFF